jgi:hypothetical protein
MKPAKSISVAAAACCLALSSVAMVGAACAADGKTAMWVGSWKLDAGKSRFTGDTFTYSQAKPGMYHFDDGSAGSYDFGADGKEYPGAYGRTTVWTPVSDHAWDTVTKLNGAVLYKAHRELSADGHTLTVTATGANPDGTAINETTVYTRVSGDRGLIGTWRDVKTSSTSPEEFVISSPTTGVLQWEVPQWKATVEAPLNGTDVPVKGPQVPAGSTYAAKLVAPNKITYVMKFNGQPDMYGESTMAADGRSYSDVSWNPGKEGEKSTALYVKQ